MIRNGEYAISDELYNLCDSIESNKKNVTKITNCLGRIKIKTVGEFKETSLDEIVERIKNTTGLRLGEKTMTTLIKMHG